MLFPLFAVFGYLGLGILLLEAYCYATDKSPYDDYINIHPLVIFYVIVLVTFAVAAWMFYLPSMWINVVVLVLVGIVLTAILLYETPPTKRGMTTTIGSSPPPGPEADRVPI